MKKILGALTILTIIDPGFTGDKKSGKKDENFHQPSGSSFIQLSDLNRTTLDAYHETDPYSLGHGKRMAERLRQSKPKTLRDRAIYLIDNLCSEWYRITGLNQSQTRKLLDEIYSNVNTDGPYLEGLMRHKLLEVRPDFLERDPEIIRSVVHNWYRFLKREGRIDSRDGEADLLYTYNQVRYGEGGIYNRLADKWRQFHPNMSNYNNISLFKKAHNLSKEPDVFSPEEMEAARVRYEGIFGPANPRTRMRMKWTDDQEDDLLYLTSLYKRHKITGEDFKSYWRAMHPERASETKTNLRNKRSSLKRRKNKEELTPEEEAAAESRLVEALTRAGMSRPNETLEEQGGLRASENFQEQDIHQREPSRMFQSSPVHSDYDFVGDDRGLRRMIINEETSSHPSTPRPPRNFRYGSNNITAPNQVPFGISHSHFGQSTHVPYSTNPYYGHGSSSYSHYDPHTAYPYYEHGSSSHSHYNPNITNPYYEYGSSSHSKDKPHLP